jgi:hypothetical protein
MVSSLVLNVTDSSTEYTKIRQKQENCSDDFVLICIHHMPVLPVLNVMLERALGGT